MSTLRTKPSQLSSLELHVQVSCPCPPVPFQKTYQSRLRVPLFSNSTKEAQPEEDPSVSARLQRLQNNYEDFGMRRTVEGILVVHDHGHPHILMLQIANAFFKLYVPCYHPAISLLNLSYIFISCARHLHT